MSTLHDQIRLDMLGLMTDTETLCSQSVSYAPRGSAGRTVNAIVLPDAAELVSEDSSRIRERKVEVLLSTDATAGVASPQLQDTITIDGDKWEVIRIVHKTAAFSRLMCRREEHISRTDGNQKK